MKNLYNAEDWVFDLDNTLYPAHCDLFPQIQIKMNEYVANFLDLPKDQARAVQKDYYVKYGTTLNGLMTHHDIDPHHYLHHVHDIDYSKISPDVALRNAIQALPGRKMVFTNGSRKHAENTVAALGLDGIFHDMVDIAATNFTPKPDIKAFEAMISAHNINPKTSVMVEDLSKNLLTAHEMGFATILVWSDKIWHDEPKGHAPAGQSDSQKEHIHFATNNLGGFLQDVVDIGRTPKEA